MRQQRILSSAVTQATLLLGLSACGGGGDDRESVACPAYVDADEPSLILASVQNAATSAPLPVVVLSDIMTNGVRLPVELVSRPALNVRVVGNTLECTLPCGFSTSSGEQTFTVSSPGYTPQKVTAKGSYASIYGACPPTQTGGNRIAVRLQPI